MTTKSAPFSPMHWFHECWMQLQYNLGLDHWGECPHRVCTAPAPGHPRFWPGSGLMKCRSCGSKAHWTAGCPYTPALLARPARTAAAGQVRCRKCGAHDHFSKDCPAPTPSGPECKRRGPALCNSTPGGPCTSDATGSSAAAPAALAPGQDRSTTTASAAPAASNSGPADGSTTTAPAARASPPTTDTPTSVAQPPAAAAPSPEPAPLSTSSAAEPPHPPARPPPVPASAARKAGPRPQRQFQARLKALLVGACASPAALVRRVDAVLEDLAAAGEDPDLQTYTLLLELYGTEAAALGHEIDGVAAAVRRRGLPPDAWYYSCLISAYGKALRLGRVAAAEAEMRGAGVPLSTLTFNVLCDVYGKGHDRAQLLRLWGQLKEMAAAGVLQPTVVTYTVLMHGFAEVWDATSAGCVWEEMLEASINPNAEAFNVMLELYGGRGHLAQVERIRADMVGRGVQPTEATFKFLIKSFHYAGSAEDAMRAYEEMRDHGLGDDCATKNMMLWVLSGSGRRCVISPDLPDVALSQASPCPCGRYSEGRRAVSSPWCTLWAGLWGFGSTLCLCLDKGGCGVHTQLMRARACVCV